MTAKATSEIEQVYEIHSGAIRRIGEEFSWLAEAASAIAGATGWPKGAVRKLSELSERLIYGVGIGYIAMVSEKGFRPRI